MFSLLLVGAGIFTANHFGCFDDRGCFGDDKVNTCEDDGYGHALLFFDIDRNFESAWKTCERFNDLYGAEPDFGTTNQDGQIFFKEDFIESETHGYQLIDWRDQVSGKAGIVIIRIFGYCIYFSIFQMTCGTHGLDSQDPNV